MLKSASVGLQKLEYANMSSSIKNHHMTFWCIKEYKSCLGIQLLLDSTEHWCEDRTVLKKTEVSCGFRLEARLLHIFQDVHAAYMSLESRLKAEGFKLRVMQMFRAWEEWAVYPKDFLIKLQNTFLGLTNTVSIA
jgi:hypothetical protein